METWLLTFSSTTPRMLMMERLNSAPKLWVIFGLTQGKFLSLLKNTGFSQNKAKALHKVNKQHFGGKKEAIYDFIARDALSGDVYSIAQTFSLQATDSAIAIELLDKWSATGFPEEKPWFVTRYILLKLSSEKLADANLLFNHYSAGGCFEQAKSLEKILRCLLKAIDIKAAEIFQAVEVKFHPFVHRDRELGDLLDRIGQIYFGIVKQRQFNMMEMMSRMLGA